MTETKEAPYLLCDVCGKPIYSVYWKNCDNRIVTHTCNKCHYAKEGV